VVASFLPVLATNLELLTMFALSPAFEFPHSMSLVPMRKALSKYQQDQCVRSMRWLVAENAAQFVPNLSRASQKNALKKGRQCAAHLPTGVRATLDNVAAGGDTVLFSLLPISRPMPRDTALPPPSSISTPGCAAGIVAAAMSAR